MNRSEIVKNLLFSFYKQNQDKLKLCKDVGFEYASISDRIKIGTNATELLSLIDNEIKPRMKIDNFSGIYNSVIIVGNKIIDKRNGN